MLDVTVTDAHRDALENQFGLADRIVDETALTSSVARFRERGISLPTFAELADPSSFRHAEQVGDADPHGPGAHSPRTPAPASAAWRPAYGCGRS